MSKIEEQRALAMCHPGWLDARDWKLTQTDDEENGGGLVCAGGVPMDGLIRVLNGGQLVGGKTFHRLPGAARMR
jgi:hypothetical protein